MNARLLFPTSYRLFWTWDREESRQQKQRKNCLSFRKGDKRIHPEKRNVWRSKSLLLTVPFPPHGSRFNNSSSNGADIFHFKKRAKQEVVTYNYLKLFIRTKAESSQHENAFREVVKLSHVMNKRKSRVNHNQLLVTNPKSIESIGRRQNNLRLDLYSGLFAFDSSYCHK